MARSWLASRRSHRADDGVLVCLLGGVRHVLANLDAGDIGRNRFEGPARFFGTVRLHVERIHLRWTATQPDEDDRAIGGSCLKGGMGWSFVGQGLHGKQISQTQAKHAQRTNSDEISASE